MNVKWLRRIKLVEAPVMAINETKQYTILRPDGKAWQFYFPQEVKSFITHPVTGAEHEGTGLLRDFGHRIFRKWPHQQGRGLGRRRQELGTGGAAAAGAEQSVHPLPHRRGAGTAPRLSCKAARPMRPAMYSRHGRHSLPSAGRRGARRMWPRSPWSTATPSRAGGSTPTAR